MTSYMSLLSIFACVGYIIIVVDQVTFFFHVQSQYIFLHVILHEYIAIYMLQSKFDITSEKPEI